MPRIPQLSTDLSPAAIAFDGRLYVAVRESGGDGVLLASSATPLDNTSWEVARLEPALPPPGPEQVRTSHAPALSVAGDRLWLAFKGHNNEAIWVVSLTSNGVWHGHGSVAGARTGCAPALAGHTVVYRGGSSADDGGPDHRLWQTRVVAGVPVEIAGCLSPRAPAAAVYLSTYGGEDDGEPVIAFGDDDRAMWYARHRAAAWDEPERLLTGRSEEPPALAMHKDFLVAAWLPTSGHEVIVASNDAGFAIRCRLQGHTDARPGLASLGGDLYAVSKEAGQTRVWCERVPEHLLRAGVDFRDVPWAATAAESTERLAARQDAVVKHWSTRDVGPWVTHRLDDETGWVRATSSLQVCTAALWRASHDRSLSDNYRRVLVRFANDYLTSQGQYEGWPALRPSEIGTCEAALRALGIGGEDYDFRLRLLVRFAYLFRDDPSVESRTWDKVIGELLTVAGDHHHTKLADRDDMVDRLMEALHRPTELSSLIQEEAGRWSGLYRALLNLLAPGLGELIARATIRDTIRGDLKETENHVLMAETSRYLTNQLIRSGRFADHDDRDRDDARFDNERNNFNRWWLRWLRQFLARGFEEYNSTGYSGLTTEALLNLYDFAEDDTVRRAARITLDYLSACFAVQSFDLKRSVGFCRKPAHRLKPDLWDDPLAAVFAVLIGNYAGLETSHAGKWKYRLDTMLAAATTGYRVPRVILDLALDKDRLAYEVRINHARDADSPVGSGTYSHPHAPNLEILSARRGRLLSAGGRYSKSAHWWRDDVLADGGDEHDGWAHATTLITRGAQRVNEPEFDRDRRPYYGDSLIHAWGRGALEPTTHNNTGVTGNVAVSSGPFHIPHRYRPGVVDGTNGWQFLHLINSGLRVAVNNRWGVLDVADDEAHGGIAGAEFRRGRERECVGAPPDGLRTYRSSDGRTIRFDPSEPPGRWPIAEIDGRPQDRDYHDWPLIESLPGPGLHRVLWADGFGKVVINDPEGSSLILSLVDPHHPIRVRQGCAAHDLVPFARLSASSNAPDVERICDGDQATGWTAAGDHEISEREGTDLELGEIHARHVRFTFAGLPPDSSPGRSLSVHTLEIYRYRRP